MTAVFLGIDWGTTHRRAALISDSGELLAEQVDDEGAIASRGRFRESLELLLARWPQVPPDTPVVMAGMVGSAIGWQVVPYLESGVPLSQLGRHLAPVCDAPSGRRWAIVPGVSLKGEAGDVDVMRGEETQLYGALHLLGASRADGDYVLPGTHSKWVRLNAGRVVELRTYLTGELFALLREHGTLADAMRGAKGPVEPTNPAFVQGLRAAASRPALSNALFGARARVVTGGMASEAAAAYVSGLLVGAEWADLDSRPAGREPVRVIGDPALAALHAAGASLHGRRLEALDARAIQLAAWRALSREGIAR